MAGVRLDDGRWLAYDEHGDPDADDVVVLCHGTPGARVFVPGPVVGVRLLTFDRPGFGGSDPCPGRIVRDVAADVAQLLDHEGVARARVIGWSGGCPSATAIAAVLGPERIRALTLVSGPGPLDEVPGAWEALDDLRRPTAEIARRDRARAERLVARNMEPIIADPSLFVGRGRGPDRAVMEQPGVRDLLLAQIRDAVAQGAVGTAEDLAAMWLPWGFALAEVAVPTRVFQGALDPHNAADAETFAARIPGARLTVWPDGAHLAIVTHWADVLAAGSTGSGSDADR